MNETTRLQASDAEIMRMYAQLSKPEQEMAAALLSALASFTVALSLAKGGTTQDKRGD